MKKFFTFSILFALFVSPAYSQNSSLLWWQQGAGVTIGAITYSPNGDLLYGSYRTDTATIGIWDMKSGALKNTFPLRSLPSVMDASGTRIIASGTATASVEVYDSENLNFIRKDTTTSVDPYFQITAVSFLPGGNEYAVHTLNAPFIEIIDANTGVSLRKVQFPTSAKVVLASFSVGGKYAAVAFMDSTVSAFDLSDGTLIRTLKLNDRMTGVDISADGKSIVTGQIGVTTPMPVKVYSLQTGEITDSWTSRFLPPNHPRFLPDGKSIVWTTSSSSMAIKATLGDTKSTNIPGMFFTQLLKFSPQSSDLATFSGDASLQVWDMEHYSKRYNFSVSDAKGHQGYANEVIFSKATDQLITVGYDATMRVWDKGTGTAIQRINAHTESVTAIAQSPSGEYIATGSSSYENSVKIWNSSTLEFVRDIGNVKQSVTKLQYSPDGNTLGAIAFNGGAYLWNMPTGDLQRLDTARTWLSAMAFSPDGKWLAVGGRDRKVTMYQNSNGIYNFSHEFLADELNSPTNPGVSALIFSPDSRNIFTSSGDFSIRMWDIENGVEVKKLSIPAGEPKGSVYAMHIANNGNLLITAGIDNYVRFFDIQSGKHIHKIDTLYNLHKSNSYSPRLTDIALSSDAKHMAVTVEDGDVILFDITQLTTSIESQPEVTRLEIYPNPAQNILKISLPDKLITEIAIYDLAGNEIITGNSAQALSANTFLLKTDELAPGVYLIKCVTPQGTLHRQFIINK
jgi:WD40 repeat protein